MGVIRNFNLNNSSDDDHCFHIPSEGEEADCDSDHDDPSGLMSGQNRSRQRRQKQEQRNKKHNKPEPTFSALGVKGKSHKKSRRYANANLFHDFGTLVNEVDLEEISIGDFIPSSPSSFSLLMDQIGGGDFNEFLECTEDEQTIMLKNMMIENEVIDTMMLANHHQSHANTEEDYQRCFSRIAPAIRRQLIKKRVPLGILASIEQKVIDHFRNDPRTMYKTNLACSYQRFLLHACCQYLNLYCRSINANGKRLSCVRNQQLQFMEPSKLLSEYLDLAH